MENTDWRRGVARLNPTEDDSTAKIKLSAGMESAGAVKCFPIPTLLAALGVTHVDFLSLDVEGFELKILKTFPFFGDELKIDVSPVIS